MSCPSLWQYSEVFHFIYMSSSIDPSPESIIYKSFPFHFKQEENWFLVQIDIFIFSSNDFEKLWQVVQSKNIVFMNGAWMALPGAPASLEALHALHWQQCASVGRRSKARIPQDQNGENFAGTVRRRTDETTRSGLHNTETISNVLLHKKKSVKSCIKEFNKEDCRLFTLMKRSVGGKIPKQMDRRIQPRKKLPRFEFSWSCLQIWQ